MPATQARQIVLAARPQGTPRLADFRLEETAIPTPGPGQVLLRVQYLSLDPYMRGRMDDRKSYRPPVPLGGVMTGESVATVVASNASGYSEGDIVSAQTGWRTCSAIIAGPHAEPCASSMPGHRPGDDGGTGVLGMPGFTRLRRPARDRRRSPQLSGETVVVAAASGPVGSLVGQLAEASPAVPRAVGIAGGPEKMRVRERTNSASTRWSITGGMAPISPCTAVGGLPGRHRRLLRERRRCGLAGGAAAPQPARAPPPGVRPGRPVQRKRPARATMAPTTCPARCARDPVQKPDGARLPSSYDFAAEHYPRSFLREVGAGIADGRIRYPEDFVDGLDKAPEAFIGMLEGRNFGKLIVRV